MLRSITQRQRRELVFADLRPALVDLWRRPHELASARLGAAVGFLLALLVVLWAIGEHAQRRAVLQEVETQRHIAQFTEGPVAEAHARLNGAGYGDGPGFAQDIETVLRFYRRLALCVRMGSCDPAAAAAWFGDLPWRFRDRHQLYLNAAYPDEDLDALFQIISPRPGVGSKSWTGRD